MRRVIIVVVLVAAVVAIALYFTCGPRPAPVAKAPLDAAPAAVQVHAAPKPASQLDAAPAKDVGPAAPTAAAAATPREPREPQPRAEKPEKPEKTEKPEKPEPVVKAPEPQVDAGPASAPARQLDKLGPAPAPVERKLGRVTVRVRNRMGSTYVLQRVICELDGQKVFERKDASGTLDRKRDLETFDKTLDPGQHILVVRLLYRGTGFGVFKYLEGYHIDAHNDYTFTVNPGHRTDIAVEAVEKPGASLRWEDRPLINFSSRSAEDRAAAKKR